MALPIKTSKPDRTHQPKPSVTSTPLYNAWRHHSAIRSTRYQREVYYIPYTSGRLPETLYQERQVLVLCRSGTKPELTLILPGDGVHVDSSHTAGSKRAW